MPDRLIDLRSDTVTRPTPAMRAAMADAEVGDDVFDDDPTVHRLEKRFAEMLGKEASLYVPSGTMSNQIALRLHCMPGDELICEAGCHIYNMEQAAYAQLSGISVRAVDGQHGVLQLDDLQDKIRPDDDHCARTRLVCIENTHNRGAGRIQPIETVAAICRWAHGQGLRTHLDGARLFNAVVQSGIAAREWVADFDTVSVCFSKGLGAPVGSALAGPAELIRQARRHRKAFGGGMRQAGIIAAGALYALENHVERLAEDHANAQVLADAIRQIDGLTLSPADIDTNIVIFDLAPEWGSARDFVDGLKQEGLLMLAVAPQRVRALTHLDVTTADVNQAAHILARATKRGGSPFLRQGRANR